MEEYSAHVHHQHHRRVFGLRLSALIELALFFAAAILLNLMIDSSPRFVDVYPHPFWIAVVFISAQYGVNEGLFAVLIATLVLLLGNLPEQQIDQDFYDWLFEVALRPIMWLMTAVALGELRSRHIHKYDKLIEDLEDTREREVAFADSFEKVRNRKEQLELNIVNRVRTETGALRAARAIEKLNPDQVIDGVSTMVKSALGAEKFSLYLLQGEGLECRLTEGWSQEDHDRYPRLFHGQDALFKAVITQHETLCVLNEEHERLLNGAGVLAGCLKDPETGTVLGMLKIESIPFLELNLETVQSFRALCEWIALALLNAKHYQSAMDDATINPEHNLMTRSFFNRHRDYITSLAKRVKFNVFMLNVNVSNHDALDPDTRVRVARLVSSIADKALRQVDFAFDHQQTNGHYVIILPATDARGARIVRDRIEKELLKETSKHARGVNYSFSLSALHEE